MLRQYPVLVRLTIILLFIILVIYSLIQAKHILYPIALSVLFSYLLYPLAAFFEYKLKFPRVLAVLIPVLLFLSVISGALYIFITQIQSFVHDNEIKEQAVHNILFIQAVIEGKYNVSPEDQSNWIAQSIREFFENEGQIKSIILWAAGAVEALLFIPIFTFFMLLFRHRAETFAHKLAQRRHAELAEKVIKQISKVTIKYISGVSYVVLILAVLHSTALSIIGIKYALVLGILTASFSFIPYFGTIVSGIVPVLFTLIANSNPYLAIVVAIYYIGITLIDHNILTPSIVGGKVHLNPFITILSIIIGAAIWGIPGMIIVVPFMGVVKIICDNVESLKPFGYILGVDKHGLSINKIARFFMKKNDNM
jgi:predicted PurR-regulated permease PerM